MIKDFKYYVEWAWSTCFGVLHQQKYCSVWDEKLNEMLSSEQLSPFSQDVYDIIEAYEYALQGLWGFPKDPAFHTWKHRYNFKCQWAGRKFRCVSTGEEFTIPSSVEERDYFSFGESAIDVGRLDYYFRTIGDVVEITEEGNED